MRRYATPYDVAMRIALIVSLLYVRADIDALLPGAGLLVTVASVWLVITLAARTANRPPQPCDCPCRRTADPEDPGQPQPRCSAHGDVACDLCSLNGPCTECFAYAETGMHWDTCPNRIRSRGGHS
jgi:hypothetical protein